MQAFKAANEIPFLGESWQHIISFSIYCQGKKIRKNLEKSSEKSIPFPILGGDSAGMLEKLYSGNLSPRTTSDKSAQRSHFPGATMVTH
ncbi:MAG: hypothetical protein A2162_09720 [Deltaproteobacteria bacterium RBG_13_52_11b]|nr:MAG: hypothetical protein A2162_09720 [Deltaproteobacteria bacterium RBG_13_52_11b]